MCGGGGGGPPPPLPWGGGGGGQVLLLPSLGQQGYREQVDFFLSNHSVCMFLAAVLGRNSIVFKKK